MTEPILSCRLGAACYGLWGGLHLHLWCSAAIGVLAGAGAWAAATLAAALLVAINLLLRPLVQKISQRPLACLEMPSGYVVSVVCKGAEEARVRALMLQGLTLGALHLCRPDNANIEDTDRAEVTAAVTAEGRPDGALEQIVGRMSLEPTVTATRWRVEELME